METISAFVQFVAQHNGIGNKEQLSDLAKKEFGLVLRGKVYCHPEFSVRFCFSSDNGSSNTVLALSKLRHHDDKPFIVCMVMAEENKILLANSTFLKKISQTSIAINVNKITGSFNMPNICKDYKGIPNDSANIPELFALHSQIGFNGNLQRLVTATQNIVPTGRRFAIDEYQRKFLIESVERAEDFCKSPYYTTLKADLDGRVAANRTAIQNARKIKGVRQRGIVVEYLVAGESIELKANITEELSRNVPKLPKIKTKNTLGDYNCKLGAWTITTDIKTKLTDQGSAPKAYNVDKFLKYHSQPNSVFMFYFIGVDNAGGVQTALIPVFQTALLAATKEQHHWAGRNSRGSSQFVGEVIQQLLANPNTAIDAAAAQAFIATLLGE